MNPDLTNNLHFLQEHSECFNFNIEKRIFDNYTILVRYSKRIRQLLKHNYRNISYHKAFNKRRFNNLKEKSKTYYCKRCNDILTIENFCYKCESEDLDNSESIHTNSPKSDSDSNYITDDGFVIKDDINASYIQQGFVKNDSVFFSDNELMMDDSSFSSQSLQFNSI
ncbi:16703_t:CDS:1 [Racocetra persica]|uniref:16703_t:CDS:1 n=1 Tax=Racocetra persica TaxID=160502 RepID=A0ACA9QWB7_9GLOM|nr:16703_t:CDS:1 [Racocetra persica]